MGRAPPRTATSLRSADGNVSSSAPVICERCAETESGIVSSCVSTAVRGRRSGLGLGCCVQHGCTARVVRGWCGGIGHNTLRLAECNGAVLRAALNAVYQVCLRKSTNDETHGAE
jgi:hypothetical protein